MAATKLTEKLTAIADAIRAKTGNSEKMTLDQMPVEIGNIQTGGGGSAARDYEVNDVTFYDYDGTIVYSCSMEDVQNLTELPTPPEHKGLVFQEWNWTLEEIKSSSVGADVGAMYDTEDGALVFNIEVKNEVERKNICLQFGQVSGSKKNPHISIDWGDGITEISSDAVAFSGIDMSHSYEKNGKYSIRVKRSDHDCDGFKMTYAHPTGYSLISKNKGIDYVIDSVLIGSDCGEIDNNTFSGTNTIRNITVHKDLVLPNTSSVFSYKTGMLRCLILPPTQVNVYNMINDCSSMKIVSIPPTVVTCNVGRPNRLLRIVFPDSVNTVSGSGSTHSTLRDVRFGDNVWKIESYAFSSNENCISELYLPASLKTLEANCFTGLLGIKKYHFRSETPPTLASSNSIAVKDFGDGETTKIYVPKGCADTYKAATNWAALADYIVEEEE